MRGEDQQQLGVFDRDQHAWDGCFQRHGGSVEFLGDHLAGPQFRGIDVQSIFLLLATAALIALCWKGYLSFGLRRDKPARILSLDPVGKS